MKQVRAVRLFIPYVHPQSLLLKIQANPGRADLQLSGDVTCKGIIRFASFSDIGQLISVSHPVHPARGSDGEYTDMHQSDLKATID